MGPEGRFLLVPVSNKHFENQAYYFAFLPREIRRAADSGRHSDLEAHLGEAAAATAGVELFMQVLSKVTGRNETGVLGFLKCFPVTKNYGSSKT